MDLRDKIMYLRPTLKKEDFCDPTERILLQDDGNGPYIKYWGVPETQPTQQELDSLS